jgi:hypothetical protein
MWLVWQLCGVLLGMLTVAVVIRFLPASQKLITICCKIFSDDELHQFGAKLFLLLLSAVKWCPDDAGREGLWNIIHFCSEFLWLLACEDFIILVVVKDQVLVCPLPC